MATSDSGKASAYFTELHAADKTADALQVTVASSCEVYVGQDVVFCCQFDETATRAGGFVGEFRSHDFDIKSRPAT